MEETTRVINLQITIIEKKTSEGKKIIDKEESGKRVADLVKGILGADDVLVLDVKDFIMDIKEEENV